MDALFGEFVAPVLEGGGWERLERVVVMGVQGWEVEVPGQGGWVVAVDGGERIRGMFGGEVEVVVERGARMADHLGVGYG